ncbi:MAG: dihydrodipicolinate synthase family protein [Chloroflexi bacterium]|nr:dihydrodipicolinate synthase family protein [Chloroflexota bacterium]
MHLPYEFTRPTVPIRSRRAFAAAHVVPRVDGDGLDWDATLAYRRHLWSWGLAVAEAMDTAQRGMGLDWLTTRELIQRTLHAAQAEGGQAACGAGTDQLDITPDLTLESVESAYFEQVEFVEKHGGQIILMASRALAAIAQNADDYLRVYSRLLEQISQPVILHWLGDMFDPALKGYWGSNSIDEAMQTCLSLIHRHRAKVDGIKLSLLDANYEITMREKLPPGVRMYTGDDFNYIDLIQGEDTAYSHALLGIFDAIAPAASAALQAVDAGDLKEYRTILEPTVPLARHIFQAPTYYYKTGIVFMAYLNGHQAEFRMVGGLETKRSVEHLVELFKLADAAGLLHDPDTAASRMQHVISNLQVN